MKPFVFTVTVAVERTDGRFVSREAIRDELVDALESADPGSLSVEDSEYETVDFAIEGGE